MCPNLSIFEASGEHLRLLKVCFQYIVGKSTEEGSLKVTGMILFMTSWPELDLTLAYLEEKVLIDRKSLTSLS